MDKDNELVALAKAGDYEAFEQLVIRHERRVYALAMNILRHREDAQDVVQTAFLNAMEHLKDFREEASFGTWITRIATYAALKVRRNRKGANTVSLDAVGEENAADQIPIPEYITAWNDPAEIVERHELKRILEDAINTLPEKYRLVFALRDVGGMSVEETAKALDISKANVKVRLLRARLALREKLTQIFGDESKRLYRTPHSEETKPDAIPTVTAS